MKTCNVREYKEKGQKRIILLKLFLKITPDQDTVYHIILFPSTLYVRILIEKLVWKYLAKRGFCTGTSDFFFIFLPMLLFILKNYCHALLILSEETINLFLFWGKKSSSKFWLLPEVFKSVYKIPQCKWNSSSIWRMSKNMNEYLKCIWRQI